MHDRETLSYTPTPKIDLFTFSSEVLNHGSRRIKLRNNRATTTVYCASWVICEFYVTKIIAVLFSFSEQFSPLLEPGALPLVRCYWSPSGQAKVGGLLEPRNLRSAYTI